MGLKKYVTLSAGLEIWRDLDHIDKIFATMRQIPVSTV
jgi:hypothetical protein